MTVSIRQRFGTSEWEVVLHYGYRSTVLAVWATREEAREFAREYAAVEVPR